MNQVEVKIKIDKDLFHKLLTVYEKLKNPNYKSIHEYISEIVAVEAQAIKFSDENLKASCSGNACTFNLGQPIPNQEKALSNNNNQAPLFMNYINSRNDVNIYKELFNWKIKELGNFTLKSIKIVIPYSTQLAFLDVKNIKTQFNYDKEYLAAVIERYFASETSTAKVISKECLLMDGITGVFNYMLQLS